MGALEKDGKDGAVRVCVLQGGVIRGNFCSLTQQPKKPSCGQNNFGVAQHHKQSSQKNKGMEKDGRWA